MINRKTNAPWNLSVSNLMWNMCVWADLVSMQTAHSSFDFSSIEVADTVTLGCFDKHTTKKSNHTGRVQ